MKEYPKLTPKNETPPAVQKLCDQVHAVADGLPTLLFVPNADHSRLYPLVVVPENKHRDIARINTYLQSGKCTTPPAALRKKHDLTLEAIHAAADYLPAIVFLPGEHDLHPVNLVPETVAIHLKPCYRAVQEAQKSAIGVLPVDVAALATEPGHGAA